LSKNKLAIIGGSGLYDIEGLSKIDSLKIQTPWGDPSDEIVKAKHNDVVMIPCGYHPVVAEHGFNCYYLNFLAGTDQSLANTTDPDHEWIYNSWTSKDPRLPLVTAAMNHLNQPNEI